MKEKRMSKQVDEEYLAMLEVVGATRHYLRTGRVEDREALDRALEEQLCVFRQDDNFRKAEARLGVSW